MNIFYGFNNLGSNAIQTVNQLAECHDMHGQTIEHGHHYVPGPDICRYCNHLKMKCLLGMNLTKSFSRMHINWYIS